MFENAVKFLSSIRAVSTSDAKRLLGYFGSINIISKTKQDQLEKCPGLGPVKAENVFKFFNSKLIIGVADKAKA
jgi:ERCC4-type nuclease